MPAFDGTVMAISKRIAPTASNGSTISQYWHHSHKMWCYYQEKVELTEGLHQKERYTVAPSRCKPRRTPLEVCLTP